MVHYIIVHSAPALFGRDDDHTVPPTEVHGVTRHDTIADVQKALMPYFEGHTKDYHDWALFQHIDGEYRRMSVKVVTKTVKSLEIG